MPFCISAEMKGKAPSRGRRMTKNVNQCLIFVSGGSCKCHLIRHSGATRNDNFPLLSRILQAPQCIEGVMRGKRMVKVVPFPGWLETEIFPP